MIYEEYVVIKINQFLTTKTLCTDYTDKRSKCLGMYVSSVQYPVAHGFLFFLLLMNVFLVSLQDKSQDFEKKEGDMHKREKRKEVNPTKLSVHTDLTRSLHIPLY